MTLTAARQVADAVLYEGYLLYPYRASSSKNQVRWQFGVLGPPGAVEAGVGEEPWLAAEVLLEPQAEPRLDLHLRFLQVQARVVQQWTGADWVDVDALLVEGSRWIPFHEAVPREMTLTGLPVQDQQHPVSVPGGQDVEELHEDGRLVGRLVRTRWALQGTLFLTARTGRDQRAVVLGLRVENTTSWTPGGVAGWTDRDVAARYSFVGTHLLAAVDGARFLSLLDGPDWSTDDAAACRQLRWWPGLITADDGGDALLVAPIVLGDRPTIAPESAGDLFDATEIDEILTLRVMTMTEQEKADARGTDPRAAAILARCDGMTDAAMDLLHGARREDDVPVHGDDVPWWDAGVDARAEPEKDVVLVAGVPVSKGSRVLLTPTRRADAQDLFLAGLTAVVARVYFDVDGGTHLAVMLEDDPGSDLYGATGRYYYFAPDEVEPLQSREDAR
jgi:hypothetical protein